jgi:hypothetical protein
MPRRASLKPTDASPEELFELSFEEALLRGRSLSERVPDKEWMDTSIRFNVEGLYNWLASYTEQCKDWSLFYLLQDANWQWVSFCRNNPTINKAEQSYRALQKLITEETDYVDLADRMNERSRVKNSIGNGGKPVSIHISRSAHGYLCQCSLSLGISYSIFQQSGYAWCLSHNAKGLYAKWVASRAEPLITEILDLAEKRLAIFSEIENTTNFRLGVYPSVSLHNSNIVRRGEHTTIT